jgi:hypothetical protein
MRLQLSSDNQKEFQCSKAAQIQEWREVPPADLFIHPSSPNPSPRTSLKVRV